MPKLDFAHITTTFEGAAGPVLKDVSFSLASGEFVVVIGRSGCGKTTLLNIAAGFTTADAGRVTLDGRPVTGPGPERAVVFQDDALYPWLSTAENIAFSLRLRGASKAERREAAAALLLRVGLQGLADRPIWQLSGGQRQRVGLARALASQPAFLLMDEPLGALDAMTREQMQELLLDISFETQAGILLITHSVEEALFLATRIIVMAPGPGRIVRSLDVDFSQRIRSGETARSVKTSTEFAAARADVLDLVFDRQSA